MESRFNASPSQFWGRGFEPGLLVATVDPGLCPDVKIIAWFQAQTMVEWLGQGPACKNIDVLVR